MEFVTVPMRVPKSIAPLFDDSSHEISFERCAMLLYPFIQNLTISHGRAAELLGVSKRDLIEYYNSIGIPYLNQSKEDLLREIKTFDELMEKRA